MSTTLPLPSPDAKALSDELLTFIKTEIKTHGTIPFSRFMQLALYAPQWGYYRNTLKKFGRSGDFVTAPELSPLYSQCVANQCAEILKITGGDIVEFGAGSGVMAATILQALSEKNSLPNHYYIIEVSGFLQSEQRRTIQEIAPHCLDRVVWLETLPREPIAGVVLANEVLDAMPVCQFVWKDGVKECGVTLQDDALSHCILEKENSVLIQAVEQYDLHLTEGYTSEINLHLPGWIAAISDFLSHGLVLIMDYGFPRSEYYHPDRSMGTVMAHYQHYAHQDVLLYPGIQDITAHVDFTAVAESATRAGFDVIGFTHQAAFLLNCGLLSLMSENADTETRMEQAPNNTPLHSNTHSAGAISVQNTPQNKMIYSVNRFLQNQQILQLTSPSEMGELFKVIGLAKNLEVDVMGFQTMNRLARL